MFSLFNGIYDSYLAPSQLTLLIVGPPNAGKSALLERLKVSEIPVRPKSGNGSNNQTVHTRLEREDLTKNLYDAFVQTGAVDITGLRKSSITTIKRDEAMTGGKSPVSIEDIPRHEQIAAVEKTTSKPAVLARHPVDAKSRRFRLNICPAPERYHLSAQDQDEDYEDNNNDHEEGTQKQLSTGNVSISTERQPFEQEIMHELDTNEGHTSLSDPPRRVRCRSKEFNVDSLDLMDGRPSSLQDIPLHSSCSLEKNANVKNDIAEDKEGPTMIQGPELLQSSDEEYHMKPNAKMLSLLKIRPTIGSNLAKLDMYGAKCHIFDVGGRLQELWERYYDDCDAVIFCWKLGDDPEKPPLDEEDSHEEADDPQIIYKKQQKVLNDVRKAIPDDIPFLIFGHIFGNANKAVVDRMYSTDLLLPHYHNPMTGLCCGSAKTGAGVQEAMEWLIPLAKRQQKERLYPRRQMLEKVL